MKNVLRASFVMTGAVVAIAMTTASPVYAQHIHNQHPTTTHGGTWKRWMMISNWTGPKTVVLDNQVTEKLHTEKFSNCTCEVVNIKVSTTKKKTHSVSITGSYTTGSSIEASAKALAQEVKATAHASVTIGGGTTWTEEVSYTIEQSTTNPKCTVKEYRETIEKYDAHGTMEVADHKVVCKSTSGSSANNYCNKRTVSSKGTGFDGRHHLWITIGPCTPCPCDEPPKCTCGEACTGGETCPCEGQCTADGGECTGGDGCLGNDETVPDVGGA